MNDDHDHETRHDAWPVAPASAAPGVTPATTAIVTVNHNTGDLIAQLIWSLYRVLGLDGFARILVVDNASTDGSRPILRALADGGLIDLIAMDYNPYHGPGLNDAFDHLATSRHNGRTPIDAVWVLDSDCVVLRPDTVGIATRAMTETNAALVGQPVWDRWNAGTFGLHALLVDPAQVWREPIASFAEHGEPSRNLQESVIAAGLTMTPFPFTADGHIVHLGRGTLARVAAMEERDNRYFAWAKDHSAPHFAQEPSADRAYAAIHAAFRRDVPTLDPHSVVTAINRAAFLRSSQALRRTDDGPVD
ncbi:MAG: hypothetical protein AVDCRST_MAG87-2306 [uncultured Thermomicrobiales bacterium]|uniref:Glycosyltransferase 2-like domain-containing protein n=1 Tax=uncultured Thermomicrobiales bacterium TaxID=1645740 RepID=A0A6J4V597_9BACT|nr:MAG: hypothetical protein AVDCRST_MAG87-2306 [uncultured Thermomicrobiales bacterium]